MRFRNWVVGDFDRNTAVDFYRQGVNPLVSVFLASRGSKHIEEVQEMLGDGHSEIHDPLLMKDMKNAVACIRAAVESSERIAIYGDYDVDGLTSSVVLARWLDTQGADYEIYIPNRFGEGYGLNTAAIDVLKSKGIDLIITVDCGITALEEVKHARNLGMSVVVTDHHECMGALPEANAVVDPKRLDCNYPNKVLAGVGVAFKLICALEKDTDIDTLFAAYGDLVAVGTIADVMPVVGENRELIRRGLFVLNESPHPGILQLLKEVSIAPGKITATTVGYTLAPRLNAAGRMGQTSLAKELLLTGNIGDAKELAEALCRLNLERRLRESEIFDEAMAMLVESPCEGPIILAQKDWYQGVTGIVAAKIAERYRMPTIIISIDDSGVGRGSCRSFGSFPIFDALRSCSDILDNFGGHEMAAGLSISDGKIESFKKRMAAYYSDNIDTIPAPELKLDFEVTKPELLSVQNIQALEMLEPFGNGNPSPSLYMSGAEISSTQSIGAGKHTRLRLEKSGSSLDCIFFSMPSEDLGVSVGSLVDAAFEPQINEFRGRSSVQLRLIDIKPSLASHK
ncbi:MAG: single-stranded-DNA-specific exonuclease RecJ [Oscillospiraceae bacterium]|nr:single-stranded-DNA-specific exonuclease RecJ [Oscillospiraceae bacterium]